jgi:DNA-binding transcriptional LysR family regulator
MGVKGLKYRHLDKFITVAYTGTITEAAAKLHMSQPALSMQLKRLEQQAGIPLFTASTKGVMLTDAGRAFLEYAERIAGLEKQLDRLMNEYKSGGNGEIVIVANASIATYVLPGFLKSFKARFGGIQVRVRHAIDSEHMKMVERGEADLAISLALDLDHYSFRVTPWYMEELILFSCEEYNAGGGEVFIPQDLHRLLNESKLASLRAGKACIQVVDSQEAAVQLAAAGLGYGLAIRACLQARQPNLARIDGVRLTFPVSLLSRPAERIAESVRLFLSHLQQHKLLFPYSLDP